MHDSRCLILVAAISLSGCTSVATAWPGSPDPLETPSPLPEVQAPIALPAEWDHPPLTATFEASATPTSNFHAQTQTPTIAPTASHESSVTPVPGLFIQGMVHAASEQVVGLPGVSIYIGLSGPPVRLIAVTDQEGKFRSNLITLLNNEVVTVRAELVGFSMTPADFQWQQVARGVEIKTLDFSASPEIPITPTLTPTSQPGPPELLSPPDGAVLPQPVPPNEWAFSWAARMGPCTTTVQIQGPGGRILEASRTPAQGYLYRYATTDLLPDDALSPWTWYVTVNCPLGQNQSEVRSFSVLPAPPTVTPASPTLTPTSQPGPPELLSPPDGAVLPQPVPPNEWAFGWAARMGPCTTTIRIQGPGGRTLEASRTPAQGYLYRYVTTDLLPDDALSPWTWYVTVNCPLGRNQSQMRSFSVAPAATP